MRITQELKWQALINFFVLTFFLSACHDATDINPLTEEEIETISELPSNFDAVLFLQKLNEMRTAGCECGNEFFPAVSALKWNSLLAKAALVHSTDMFTHGFLDHTGSDNSTLVSRVNDTGYRWRLLGENIARGFFTEETVIQAWQSSAVHCRLIMNENFSEVGVGKKETYWTMVLAR